MIYLLLLLLKIKCLILFCILKKETGGEKHQRLPAHSNAGDFASSPSPAPRVRLRWAPACPQGTWPSLGITSSGPGHFAFNSQQWPCRGQPGGTRRSQLRAYPVGHSLGLVAGKSQEFCWFEFCFVFIFLPLRSGLKQGRSAQHAQPTAGHCAESLCQSRCSRPRIRSWRAFLSSSCCD